MRRHVTATQIMFRRCAATLARASKPPAGVAASSPAGDHIDELTLPLGGPRRLRDARRDAVQSDAKIIADRVKTMSDADWEAVPGREKQLFNGYIAKQIKEHPTAVTEQQRRRFYETTMHDPAAEDPARTVKDTVERIRLGLPTQVVGDRRKLGVTDAMYEKGDASLFDPDDAHRIENAVTEVKQMFVDYVQMKKAGLSTELQRRKLAKASEELNYQTQKHLAHMFKYAENKVQNVILDERQKQLRRIAAVRAAMAKAKSGKRAARKQPSSLEPSATKPEREAAVKTQFGGTGGGNKVKRLKRSAAVKRVLRDTYGLDVDTANAVWGQIQAQERFLQLCEVMCRMTLGRGFHHTSADENLDAYTAKLRDIYSADPQRLGTVDAVQYLAATEGVAPVDWATRWFQKALLLPMQTTPEFREVKRIEEEEDRLAKEAGVKPKDATSTLADVDSNTASCDAASPSTSALAATPARNATRKATSLVEKLFLPPSDPRLATTQEKRLRYIAHLHMESQIRRLRQNARLFEGAETTEEADRCRSLYAQIAERRATLEKEDPAANAFLDPQVRGWFEEIQGICNAFIKQRMGDSAAAGRAERAARIADSLSAGRPELVAAELREVKQRRKREQVERMLRLLERDVREDMTWVQNMQEADRPEPLPIPEPMSYIGAADVIHWRSVREKDHAERANPFQKVPPSGFKAKLFGQPWNIPDKPMLFWGTGTGAVQQALKHAAEDAAQQRGDGVAGLPPPFPCAENPWGWRLRRDVLDGLDDSE
jgi:hypothetical protein